MIEHFEAHELGVTEVAVREAHFVQVFLQFPNGIHQIVLGLVMGSQFFVEVKVNPVGTFIGWGIGVYRYFNAGNYSGYCFGQFLHLVVPVIAARVDGQELAAVGRRTANGPVYGKGTGELLASNAFPRDRAVVALLIAEGLLTVGVTRLEVGEEEYLNSYGMKRFKLSALNLRRTAGQIFI